LSILLTTPTKIYTLSLHDALPISFLITFAFFLISHGKDYYSAPAYPILLAAGAVAVEQLLFRSSEQQASGRQSKWRTALKPVCFAWLAIRSEEHTSELQSRGHLVC